MMINRLARRYEDMKQHKSKIFFALIIILAAALRLWGLNRYPAGLNADEAAIGYNAYSLIQTGKDEFGTPWPLNFKSFGDYKPGLYFYIVLPFVKLFGLNIWAVRLPSAILGVVSVVFIMYLAKELFLEQSVYNKKSLAAGLFLVISPWHLHFSRGGWETNVATTFLLIGTYYFLRSLKNPKYYILHITYYILSMYTYHSVRVVAPLLGLGMLIIYRKNILSPKFIKSFATSVVVGGLLIIPLVVSFFGSAGGARFSGVGIFADSGPFWRTNELRGQHSDIATPSVKLLHNKFVAYGLFFLKNYTDHFRGDFLFVSGDEIQRNKIPEMGLLYYFDFPLLLIGLYFLIKKQQPTVKIIFLWLFVAPVAAAMTFQSPHALRALNMIIPLTIISAYGFYNLTTLSSKLLSKKLHFTYYILVITSIVWCSLYYLHQYYVHYPKTYPLAWEDGFEETVNFIKPIRGKYSKIYVTDKYDQPYILFLFFLKYPPAEFQKEAVLSERDKFGFSTVKDFANFHFGPIIREEVLNGDNTLIIGTDEDVPGSTKILKVVNFRNGKPAFKIAEVSYEKN